MLRRFSILIEDSEVYSYIPDKSKKDTSDFMNAEDFIENLPSSIMNSSELKKYEFENYILYVKNYGDFVLLMLVDIPIESKEIQDYFGKLARELISILPKDTESKLPQIELIQKHVLPILNPLTITNDLTGSISKLKSSSKSQKIKIGLAGLGNAGKTTIKRKFFNQWSTEDLKSIKPTVDVEYSNNMMDVVSKRLTVLDMGGQLLYRKKHVKKPSLWQNLTTLIYIIDIQDERSFELSKKYLNNIWTLIKQENDTLPKLAIFLHKYDVNIRETLEENIPKVLKQLDNYNQIARFYLTTITDESSNIAMLKTLYLSLPVTLIGRLLEDEFLFHFEENVLPDFFDFCSKYTKINLDSLEEKLKTEGLHLGIEYSQHLQEKWMNSLEGAWTPKGRHKTFHTPLIQEKNQALLFNVPIKEWISYTKIKSFSEKQWHKLLTTFFNSILNGLMKTFRMGEPHIKERHKRFTVWEILI